MTDFALLTFSIGPVHTFIGQARRIADLWAGSRILSHLTGSAIKALRLCPTAQLVFPKLDREHTPESIPNRFVASVPIDHAEEIANALEAAVRVAWETIVDHGVKTLKRATLTATMPEDGLWADAITCSWSFVPQVEDYAEASRRGAELFAASRVYRPFKNRSEAGGTKCAICGERNALPDGDRDRVIDAWTKAETASKHVPELAPFFRKDQGRLCLVCASKRLYPYGGSASGHAARFESLVRFQPEEDERRPYFALVTMDGDRLGEKLSGENLSPGEDLRGLQEKISAALSTFAETLKTPGSPALNLAPLGIKLPEGRRKPQLIYAGGEDVLFVSDPRDALELARCIRGLYIRCFKAKELDPNHYTLSAAVVFAHTKTPAGLLLRDANDLLKEKAKGKSGRNSIAIALDKRSGPTVDVAFRWEEAWLERLIKVVRHLRDEQLASGQTYSFAEEGRVLTGVFRSDEWREWLRRRLSRGAKSSTRIDELADLLSPFFESNKIGALRIARFLAIELERETTQRGPEEVGAGGAG